MCVIIVKPVGEVIPHKYLLNAMELNPDGFGFYAYKQGEDPEVYKTLDSDEFSFCLEKVNSEEYLTVVHCRLNTAGGDLLKNVHPFKVAKDVWMFHNGTFDRLKKDKVISDTNRMARAISSFKYVKGNMDAICTLFRYLDQSRVVLVSEDKVSIANERSGEWYEGCWYSKSNVLKSIIVWVYGTLKKGERNHYHLTDAYYVGKAHTVRDYPLYSKGLPYLINAPGHGHQVEGELYLVDEDEFIRIDYLEGHPDFYYREKVTVQLKYGRKDIYSAWVYFCPLEQTTITEEDFPIKEYKGVATRMVGETYEEWKMRELHEADDSDSDSFYQIKDENDYKDEYDF